MENIFKRDIGQGVQLLAIKGDLLVEQCEDVQMALIEEFDNHNYSIIIDIAQVQVVSASILRIFNWASEIVANNQGRIMISGPNPDIYEKLEKVGMDELIEIVPDLDFAKELFEIQ